MEMPFFSTDQKPLTLEESQKAFLSLLAIVFGIFALEIIVVLIWVLYLGWDHEKLVYPLMIISIVNVLYFQWKNNQIKRRYVEP
jgi:predicted membrane chloride channel (bestrophin family)